MSDVAGMTAGELQSVFDGIPVHDPHPLTLERTSDGLTMTGELDQRSARGAGMDQLHGGTISALLDTAATLAMMAVTSEGWATVDIRIDYMRPIALGPVRIDGTCVRAGRRLGNASATIIGPNWKIGATATATLAR